MEKRPIATALQIGEQMISFLALKSVRRPLGRRAKWAGLVAGAAVAACASSPVFAQAQGKIPDLGSSSGFAWTPLTINGGIGAGGASHGRRGRGEIPEGSKSVPAMAFQQPKPAGPPKKAVA